MIFKLELLRTHLLSGFPSGSSITYRDDHLYLVGDDSTSLLVLDKDYEKISSVELFNYAAKRIPKLLKADPEASSFIKVGDRDYLLIVGSASNAQREKVILIPFIESKLIKTEISTVSIEIFISRLRLQGIPEVNIEGAIAVDNMLVLSNRGNRKNTTNHIILTNTDFWKHQREVNVTSFPVKIDFQTDDILGISEVCYEMRTDTLLICFSSEHTDNAYDDGKIGNSYLGWVHNFTKKLNTSQLTVEHLINLVDVHAEYVGEKIEGLCVESSTPQEMVIHLVSDNDDGQSKIFKVGLKISK